MLVRGTCNDFLRNQFRFVVVKYLGLYSALIEFQKEQLDTETLVIELYLGRSGKAGIKKSE